ncbi:MAG: hypothetical protein R3C05_23685 [Pirellulaceae bacterium]
MATVIATKVLHELAHGIVCRRMGARCPEIGVLLLCGTPCMYCDVTECWAIPNRWHRAAVMLAGVYIEAILASVATFVWWCAEPGPVYFACLNIMLVCGVSTMLFNLNPLMRFDGYYLLCDLIDLPNLRQQASDAWRATIVARFGGDAYRQHLWVRPRGAGWLCLYYSLSTLWRLLATVAIAAWIVAIARSAKILPIGYTMAQWCCWPPLSSPHFAVGCQLLAGAEHGKEFVRCDGVVVLLLGMRGFGKFHRTAASADHGDGSR